MFVGTFEHSIDDKGRLILPSAFRARLADGAFVTPLDNCLAVLPNEEFERMAEQLQEGVSEGQVAMDALRAFASKADHVTPDSQGRIRLLPGLRETAGIDRNVVVTGAFRHVEIRDPSRWAEVDSHGTESLVEAITRGRGFGRG
ncbi:MAG: division/cell wall cluster transcriptional repressor MraZ [Acidimicrobiales bacterium]